MKALQKMAAVCAGCLALTAMGLPAAAADDPVLTQIAAQKHDKFTVDGKKLGYTALNGECPERPEWYHMSKDQYNEETGELEYPYQTDDEWWENLWKKYIESPRYYGDDNCKPANYGVSIAPDGKGIISIAPEGMFPFEFKNIIVLGEEGKIEYQTVLSCLDERCSFNENVFSCGNEYGWQIFAECNWMHDSADYVNLKNGMHYSHKFGNRMYHGFTAVWDCLEIEKEHFLTEDIVSEDGENKTIPFSLSLINDKDEKILTLSEPMEIKNGIYGSAQGIDIYGYNYNMNLGGYSEDLIWFSCDRQVDSTLNDLVENTETEKEETVRIGSEGGTVVSNHYKFSDHQCGYADLKGNIVIPQKFDSASPFSDGLARVSITIKGENEWDNTSKYGFIDKSGNYIVEPKYDYDSWNGGTGSFSEGFAKVALKNEDGAMQFGFIDKTGKEVIALQYEDARDFSNGVAPVKKDGKWGYINTAGETVLPFAYDETCGSDGTCFVVGKTADGETKFGAVDAAGETLLPFMFEDMSTPVNGLVYAFCDRELYSFEIAEILETGDLSGNGTVGVDDAQLALKAYTEQFAGNGSGLTPGQLKAADVNGDGELTVEDAQLILMYYTETQVAGKDVTWEMLLKQ